MRIFKACARRDERGALNHGEPLFDSAYEISSEFFVGLIDPLHTLSPANVEQFSQSLECFTIGHLIQLHGFTHCVATKPNLLEVIVEILDDICSMLLQNGQPLAVRKAKYHTIHFGPELCPSSS